MPEFLQKAIDRAKARPDKLKKNLEELESLRNGEGELAKVVGWNYHYGQSEPDSDSDAAFEESRKRSATLMEDEDVQGAIMREANAEHRHVKAKEESRKLLEKRSRGSTELKGVLEDMGLFQEISITPPEFAKNKEMAEVKVTLKSEEEFEATMSQKERDGWGKGMGSLFGGDQLSCKKVEVYAFMMNYLAHFMREYDIPYLQLEVKGHTKDGFEVVKHKYLGGIEMNGSGRAFPFSQGWLEERDKMRADDEWLENEKMRRALEEKEAREKGGETKPDEE